MAYGEVASTGFFRALDIPLVAGRLPSWSDTSHSRRVAVISDSLARALTPYLALHFVASPLAVVTMAWQAQAWALRLALWGQGLFLLGLAGGLLAGGLEGTGWGVSLTMTGYFGYYLMALWRWPAPAQSK